MLSELIRLYAACFPGIVREHAVVERALSLEGNRVILRRDGERAVGCAVIHKNVILLLCVLPGYRRRGIGSELLREAEASIRADGYAEARFCDGPEYITPGVPKYPGNEAFFASRGYVHDWGDCACVDMRLSLRDFRPDGASIGDTLNSIAYRWADPEALPAVVDCANDAFESFAKYYSQPELYTPQSPKRVLIALDGELVCGALMVCIGTEQDGVGSVGCTVTRTAYQGRGIATTMVRLGTGHLAGLGLPTAFLGYTYTDIIPMYARSGYAVCMEYMMAVKPL